MLSAPSNNRLMTYFFQRECPSDAVCSVFAYFILNQVVNRGIAAVPYSFIQDYIKKNYNTNECDFILLNLEKQFIIKKNSLGNNKYEYTLTDLFSNMLLKMLLKKENFVNLKFIADTIKKDGTKTTIVVETYKVSLLAKLISREFQVHQLAFQLLHLHMKPILLEHLENADWVHRLVASWICLKEFNVQSFVMGNLFPTLTLYYSKDIKACYSFLDQLINNKVISQSNIGYSFTPNPQGFPQAIFIYTPDENDIVSVLDVNRLQAKVRELLSQNILHGIPCFDLALTPDAVRAFADKVKIQYEKLPEVIPKVMANEMRRILKDVDVKLNQLIKEIPLFKISTLYKVLLPKNREHEDVEDNNFNLQQPEISVSQSNEEKTKVQNTEPNNVTNDVSVDSFATMFSTPPILTPVETTDEVKQTVVESEPTNSDFELQVPVLQMPSNNPEQNADDDMDKLIQTYLTSSDDELNTRLNNDNGFAEEQASKKRKFGGM